jgi:hypothetical protein
MIGILYKLIKSFCEKCLASVRKWTGSVLGVLCRSQLPLQDRVFLFCLWHHSIMLRASASRLTSVVFSRPALGLRAFATTPIARNDAGKCLAVQIV